MTAAHFSSSEHSLVERRLFLQREWDDNGWFSWILPVLTAIACFAATFAFDTTGDVNNTLVIAIGLCVLAAVLVWVRILDRELTTEHIMVLLFVAAFLLRLNYVLYTDVSLSGLVRQHDVGAFTEDGRGHAAYIYWFYRSGLKLPENPTMGLFYHPPLHHFLAAMWMRFLTKVGFSFERAVTSIQYLTLFYSSCCTLVMARIIDAFGLKGRGKVAAFAIAAFHPTFIILAGSVNNDILCLLCTIIALYATVRWYQTFSVRWIVCIAVSIGSGMMAKLTAAVLAPAIALVFFIKLFQVKGERLKCLGQLVLFGCVSFPLGLWYPVWKLICYQVPLNYVILLSTESPQYVGNMTASQRLFEYSPKFFSTPFQSFLHNKLPYSEYNPFISTVKTSVFGEYNLGLISANMESICYALLFVNIALIALSLIAMLRQLISLKDMEERVPFIFLVVYHVTLFAYYIKFCFDYPHTCSMDYRYIVPTCLLGALYIGMRAEALEADGTNRYALFAQGTISTLIVAFCVLSAFLYTMLGVY